MNIAKAQQSRLIKLLTDSITKAFKETTFRPMIKPMTLSYTNREY